MPEMPVTIAGIRTMNKQDLVDAVADRHAFHL
jgi:hypothetical protein